ncbi:MAG: DNA-directed RNA polymerase [Candidatus Micrarchaeota archaeon]|nr:DNA-directed RNA polymerase [Candidatus Micrarchaeota archaeon]
MSREENEGSGHGRGRSWNREGYGNREMHKATCSDCGSECEVPFKPAEGRPVYCRECFQKHRRY